MVDEQHAQNLTVPDDNTALAQQPVCDVSTVQSAQSGDKEAFTQLFMQTYRAMYFTAKSVLSNDEDIYDALQNGYTKAYKYITRLSSPEKFYPWLHTIIHNAALDVLKDAHAYSTEEYTDIADTADVQTDAERRADLRRVLEKLDGAQAQVLTLHYYDGLSLADIARMLDLPASTVRSRLQAAKKQLRVLLEQHDIDQNLYGGTVSAMIVTGLRNIIGTDILSAVVAQDMLDNILGGKNGRLEQAVYKMMRRQRDNRVKHLAATLLAVCIGAAALTALGVFALIDGSQHGLPTAPSGAVSSSSDSSSDTASAPLSSAQAAYSTETTSKTTTTTTAATTTAKTDTFVHDYRDGRANTVGNTVNNLSLSEGWIAEQDGWLYYYVNGYLQKIKTDGSDYQLLTECSSGCLYVNVVGDWIYYNSNGIRRIRTDGSEGKIITTQNCSYLSISESIGYFITDDSAKLYRLDTNDMKAQHIFTFTDGGRGQTAVYDNLLIYLSYDNTNEESLIVRDLSCPDEIKWKKQLQSKANNRWSNFFINGRTLYIFTNGTFCSVNLNQNDPTIQNITNGLLNDSSVDTAIAYYSPYKTGIFAMISYVGAAGHNLHLYNMNGEKVNTISGDRGLDTPLHSFEDGNVYYVQQSNLYKAKGDMSGITLLHE